MKNLSQLLNYKCKQKNVYLQARIKDQKRFKFVGIIFSLALKHGKSFFLKKNTNIDMRVQNNRKKEQISWKDEHAYTLTSALENMEFWI